MARDFYKQRAQWGRETYPGTAVAGSKRDLSFTAFSITPKWKIEKINTAGQRVSAGSFTQQEWTEGKAEGHLCWNNTPPTLTWVNGLPSITDLLDGTYEMEWGLGAGAPRTIEYGDDEVAGRAAGCFAKSLDFTWGRNSGDASLSVEFMGGIWDEDNTLTASPTASAVEVIEASQVDVFIDSSLANIGTTQAPTVIKAEFKTGEIRGALWHLNSSEASFAADSSVGKRLDSAELSLMIDDAEGAGQAFIAKLRSHDITYIRVQATGAPIGSGAGVQLFQFDGAFQCLDFSQSDEDDAVVVTIPLGLVQDTSGFSHIFRMVTTAATA